MSKKSLAETHPELAKQWHPNKNGKLKAYVSNLKQTTKYWWKCDKADDHEWEATISKRKNGRGCPFCAGQKVAKSNCFAIIKKKESKFWHPTKNGKLTPYDFTPMSDKIVWWKCDKGIDHVWESAIKSISRGRGCSICAGKKVVESNSLATTNPDLAKEWHPTKNKNLTPSDVTEKGSKKVWWKCDKGDDHEWQSTLLNRANGNGCPICDGKKVVKSNSLTTLSPEIAREWHPKKNGKLSPADFTLKSNAVVWWKCDKGDDHEWETSINLRTYANTNCPICVGQKVVLSNCFATKMPKLAIEWHPTKNGNLSPFEFMPFSEKKVWWKCDKGDDHEWLSSIKNRSLGNGCTICSGHKVVESNCLETLKPKIASEWHPIKNGKLKPNKVTTNSGRKVWWKCDRGEDHEWETTIASRTSGNGCPYCTLTPQSKQELTITFELIKLFKNIDPKGLKTKLEGRLRAIDIFIPKLNLCIEFDGSYWHKDKRDIDKIKSEMLFKEGFKLIRVREEPLKKIYDTDVISKLPYDGKIVTNDILSMILSTYNLDNKLAAKIREYQSKDGLQNEKGLENYIDRILTEKAEKKKSK